MIVREGSERENQLVPQTHPWMVSVCTHIPTLGVVAYPLITLAICSYVAISFF